MTRPYSSPPYRGQPPTRRDKVILHLYDLSVTDEKDAENRARNEVAAAYNRYRNSQTGLANYNTQFLSRLSDLNRSANQNFQRRNISLLQFIDQQRIYIETNLQLIDMQQLHLNNVNDLNFSAGTTLIDY